ncbi:hypothetical protein SNO32_000755 [Cronobacter sakazakii]|uniref:hypothetical protein n=1 Tax=Cronobacter sakazakii TaxID=28141 RepID=UPI000BE84E9A|nr:hypothetical protein [Cronobacter sakazakii]ELY6089855.1 hypothetical protein [Cronobacter sakazakii]PUV58006.1 hypothetical protein CDT94_03040 [Cronobacter sakazakii]
MKGITNEQLDILIKSAVNSAGPLPPDEKFSQIISALRELKELRALRERAEPVAWTEKCEITNMLATGLYLRGFPDSSQGRDIPLYTAPPAPVVPEGLRIALSNAGIAAPESDEMLWASQKDYTQMLVTWVKDRKPFKQAPVVPEWTNQQCLEFLAIAFRHAEIKGDFELDDLRLGVKMANAMTPGKEG